MKTRTFGEFGKLCTYSLSQQREMQAKTIVHAGELRLKTCGRREILALQLQTTASSCQHVKQSIKVLTADYSYTKSTSFQQDLPDSALG